MRIILLIISLIAFTQSSGQTKLQTLEITRLTDNFYVYTTYHLLGKDLVYPANSMYLVTARGVVLFDTPWDTTQFQPLLDSIEAKHHKKVIACFATHSHEDRTAGLEFYRAKGIRTFTSRKTDSICAIRNNKRAEFLLQGDSSFHIGGYQFLVFFPGAGHTSDNLVVWFDKQKILYGGCFIKSTAAADLGNLADADTQAWPASIKKVQLQCKAIRYVIPGHQDWTNPNSLEHTLALLEAYHKQVKQ